MTEEREIADKVTSIKDLDAANFLFVALVIMCLGAALGKAVSIMEDKRQTVLARVEIIDVLESRGNGKTES